MKLVSFLKNGNECVGLISEDRVYDIYMMYAGFPDTMNKLLAQWDTIYPDLLSLSKRISTSPQIKRHGIPISEVTLMAPVPHPSSLRDGYAFRQHVETARRNRGLEMTPVFDSFPVFYFGNHHTVLGPGPVHCMPDHLKKLDFELEAAVVITRKGKNIRAKEADAFIAGLMIMNDFSARDLQMEEMLLNLGPAKGKDFATTTGPWLVTLEELKAFETTCKKNHVGKSWNLQMTAFVNGKPVSLGNLSDMEWTFAELIERASYGADLYPGDIIGSGTVGTGCFLELNGTGKLNDPGYSEQWLEPGDRIDLKIEGLGTLQNQILAEPGDYSILQLKKQ
ncbi:MAG TPA: fumarylacetoacetate hydrolase family protein [Puia sp.]|jgi:fumarylacetoacetate (FAA) hydrolase|nr:fumarylacetoacetate hydrolase family protein [Puia sp.]